MNDKISLVIQARTGSSRLPFKMIKPFYENKSVLEILLSRLLTKFGKDTILVATTDKESDKSISNICKNFNISYYRGSENDVLQRFIDTAEKFKINKIIRICADNVFIDLDALTFLYEEMKHNNFDYVSYMTSTGCPSILTHYGFWAEGVSLKALKEVRKITSEIVYHEHVTNYIHSHQENFNCKFFLIPEQIESHKDLRLTLDTLEDFEIQKDIFKELIKNKIDITPCNIIKYLQSHSSYYEIMRRNINLNTK